MCGIAGILLNSNCSLPDLPERLRAMIQALHHRGPDDEGVYISSGGRAGIANRRLAIRDLSPTGHMPMTNSAGTVWITYNGEIYNTAELRLELERKGYCFRSTSDTEIILHGYEAWGEAVVGRLRGMFAFAVLSLMPSTGSIQRLFLARDHMGIKPLYYARTETAFVFASELKALLASGLISREVNPAGLVGYLMLGNVPNPLTIYQNVVALEPASTLCVEPDCLAKKHPVPYWFLPADSIPLESETAAIEQVQSLLAESVRIRLVSDVPLGAFLSGGLDSTTVVALMRRATSGLLRTCSMVFSETGYSEGTYARASAEMIGAEHYERVVTAEDVAKELNRILVAMDQPTVDGVNTYFVSQTAREAGLTVALSGLGGDELFGGYPTTFREAPKFWQACRVLQAAPGGVSLARATLGLLSDYRHWAKVQDALARPASLASAYLVRRGLFAPTEIQALLYPDLWQAGTTIFDPIQHIIERTDNGGSSATSRSSTFAWISRAELRTYTHHQLLRDTDVMSMIHSLEVRVPLLDYHLVETVLRLPESIKLKGLPGPKPLLVRALGDSLPPLVRERRDKMGFTFPFALWLRNRLKAPTEDLLHSVETFGLLRPGVTEQIWQEFQAGALHWSRPWALAALAAINLEG
jgi:asparagine synthase (glutamine-hydrolysing)